ncbi:hypothetical protein [Anaeromicropila herbilytica]|uniref:Uncharacterized protein n=1 Tax=Anaeromicropila herbilytica TaxID=2785025 RepID=A0A7R7IC55_9FIRM|nr:hypothetical protein [Anaeromicropila herbilytica]BCN30247.1 hypothetical protein bsdtb5_15420 [Anaeromicropila herbilytica]
MKLTNLAIVFSVLSIATFVIIDAKVNNLCAQEKMKIEYNRRIDNAIDDGIYELVELDNNRKISLNKENAVNMLMNSLYSNFNVLGQKVLEEKLGLYIPIITVIDRDGFYIYHIDVVEKNGERVLERHWTDKIPYSYEKDNLIYRFTLDQYVYLYDKTTNVRSKGLYTDLKSQYPNSILSEDTTFEHIRRRTIINQIEDYMREYINQHNHIAQNFGITYEFYLPQIEKNDWYRTIDDISMLVLFQGYPYGITGEDFYNRYAFGGARITKSKSYYVEKSRSDGRRYYHKDNCSELQNKDEMYSTKEECAKEGAFPCSKCKP